MDTSYLWGFYWVTSPHRLCLNHTWLSLASLMGTGFTDWVVHFGSCKTIDMDRNRIVDFIEATGFSMVLGYRRKVCWAEATALEFLLLDWLQGYRDMRRMWKRFRKNYKDLISITGLRAFHG